MLSAMKTWRTIPELLLALWLGAAGGAGAGTKAPAAKPVSPRPSTAESFRDSLEQLRTMCPRHFLPDVQITVARDLKKPMAFGEPDPPEGFAGPDPTGRHALGIYFPRLDKAWFPGDISNEQWMFHEMFHLHNRRLHDYDPFILRAFPDETDPLVKWMKRSRYHRTFAREEAFINLVTFADPPHTPAQWEVLRAWYDSTGANRYSFAELRQALNAIPHF